MTRAEYEHRRQRLDRELRTGIEALETAHRLQVRALDLTWMMLSQESVAAAPPPASAPTLPAPQEPAATPAAEPEDEKTSEDLMSVIARCPDVFDRNDVCRTLGFEPERSILYRALQGLVRDGTLTVLERGEGRVPTRYAKRASLP
jgi:hypothetical protein